MSCHRVTADDILNTPKHIQHNVYVTLVVICVFGIIRSIYENIWKKNAKIDVVIIGAGPVGLTAALVAAKSSRVRKIIILEPDLKTEIKERKYQINLDRRTTDFLRSLGVDFDNLEGCWDDRCFYTRVGIYLEYVLSILQYSHISTEVLYNTKVSSLNL